MARALPRTSAEATSVAAIGKHPIHPMLIPFPVAFLTAALGTDVAYARTKGSVLGPIIDVAAAPGPRIGSRCRDGWRRGLCLNPRARKHAIGPLHAVGNATVLALSLGNLASRWKDPEEAVMPRGLAMSAATAALLGVTAWAGAELVYRHRVAVVEEEDAVADDLIGQH